MKVSIKDLSEDDRPREKLMKYGAEALSKSELLAILVGSGNGEENAVSLMQRIMHDSGDNLQNLAAKSLDELRKYKGIGTAKAVTIKAACQIAKLMQAENVDKGTQMDSPQKVNDYFAPKLSGRNYREFGGHQTYYARSRNGSRHLNDSCTQSSVGERKSQQGRRPPYSETRRSRKAHEHNPSGPRNCGRRKILQLSRRRETVIRVLVLLSRDRQTHNPSFSNSL